jgi:hypothetical protein
VSRQDSVHALSVEIGRPPRLAYIENPAEVPSVPDAPTVFVIDDFVIEDEYHVCESSPQAFERLLEVVSALMRDAPVVGITAVYEPKGFAPAYHRFLDGNTSRNTSSVLLYVPPPNGGKHAKLARESLLQTRKMLERFEYRVRTRVSNKAESDEPQATLQLEAARQRRAELLEQTYWLNGNSVHQQQGGDADAPGAGNTASRLRRKGELLGAWGGREYLHPAFQFDRETGRLMPEVKSLLELLPKDRSGWRQSFWLFQPHAALDGKQPADVFQSDPQTVIEAARSTFAPGDTNW